MASGRPFSGADDGRRRVGRQEPNKRTVEGEAFARAWLDANANAILAEILASDDIEAKWRALAFFFEQAHGKARQRIALSGDAPLAVILTRAGAPCGLPESAPAPTGDCEPSGAIPGDLSGPALGEDPDGV